MKSSVRKLRRTMAFWKAGFRPKVQSFDSSKYLGSVYGGWSVIIDLVDRDSIVYSAGVGHDITFDLELIGLCGCKVDAFDPTPGCVSWLEGQSVPHEFHFHKLALSGSDGNLRLYTPVQDGFVSCSAQRLAEHQREMDVPAKTVRSIMDLLGHSQIDVLKMDIEGAEYDVLDSMIQNKIFPGQVLVEFHHRVNRLGLAATTRAYRMLLDHGYVLFHLSDLGDEFSFVRRDLVGG